VYLLGWLLLSNRRHEARPGQLMHTRIVVRGSGSAHGPHSAISLPCAAGAGVCLHRSAAPLWNRLAADQL